MNLKPALCLENVHFDYSYNSFMQRFNILDHFILSNALFDKARVSHEVKHDGDNLSDHEALFMRFLQLCRVSYTTKK